MAMVDGNLNTTNALLAVMAAVSVLQALVLIAVAIVGVRLYRQVMRTVSEIEQRQIAPLATQVQMLLARVDDILADVKGVTGRVTRGTERVDATADRVRSSVASRISQLAGFLHVVRSAIAHVWNGEGQSRAPSAM